MSTEEKIDRILLLLDDPNVGLCWRVKNLENTVNGNGKPGLAEKVRGLQSSSAKVAAYISTGIGLLSYPIGKFIARWIP